MPRRDKRILASLMRTKAAATESKDAPSEAPPGSPSDTAGPGDGEDTPSRPCDLCFGEGRWPCPRGVAWRKDSSGDVVWLCRKCSRLSPREIGW